MDVLYGVEIPKSSLNDILKATQDMIRIKQICKYQIPSKCSNQVNNLLVQNFHNTLQQNQQQPFFQNKSELVNNIRSDNRTPMKLKLNKNFNSQINKQRLSFDSTSFRKSSAIKSRRDQCTASTTHRKKLDNFSKTYDGSFLQQRPWTQTQCRKKFARTADLPSRNKYLLLKNQNQTISIDDEFLRKQLRQRRLSQKKQHEKIQNTLMKLSYQRRALQEQFQAAKNGDKKNSLNKNKQPNQIISYQTQNNGSILTNKFKKAYRKTIQHIINIEYEQRTRDRILKRKSQREYDLEGKSKSKGQQEQNQRQKQILMNINYNNGGRRQISLIPYVSINPGVSLSQNTIQASISRARPLQQLSRQKFFSSIQNKTFRSYSKEGSPQRIDKKMMTIDVCDNNRASKSTLNNETKDSFRKSILWGPKTSRDGHHIKLQKQDFLRQFTD